MRRISVDELRPYLLCVKPSVPSPVTDNPTSPSEARLRTYGLNARTATPWKPTKCAAECCGDDGVVHFYQCTKPPGFGAGNLYCKQHTREFWPEMSVEGKRVMPDKPQLETPWAKKFFAPWTAWKTRKLWPVGSVLLRRNNNGFATMPGGYKMPFGLGVGTGDWIGFKSLIITQEMVGQRIAQFASIEAKRDGKDLEGWQQKWHEMLLENGALSMRASPDTETEVMDVLRS